ncbi:Uncharacterized protein Fot_25014 [Forsythia ovata]|uniref:Uncharacterized protein n=1 Tax=Forsythia ovata TaxID=205694 RepID=A0ABD1U7Y3_9LAMI
MRNDRTNRILGPWIAKKIPAGSSAALRRDSKCILQLPLGYYVSSSSKGKIVTQSNIHHASESFILATEEAHYPDLNLSQDAQYQPWLPTYGSSQPLMSMYPLVRQPEEEITGDLLTIPGLHVPHNQ